MKGYISGDLINDVIMIKWISGYKERKKKYDDDYKVRKVIE